MFRVRSFFGGFDSVLRRPSKSGLRYLISPAVRQTTCRMKSVTASSWLSGGERHELLGNYVRNPAAFLLEEAFFENMIRLLIDWVTNTKPQMP